MAHLAEKADAKVHQIAHRVEDSLGAGPHPNRGFHRMGGRAPYMASGAGGYQHAAPGAPHMAGGAGGYHGAAGGFHHMGGLAPHTNSAGPHVGGPTARMRGVFVPALGGRHHLHHGMRRPVGAGPHAAGGGHHVGGPAAYGGGAGPHFGGRLTGFYVGGARVQAPGGPHRHHHQMGGPHHAGGRPANRIMHPVRGGGMQHLTRSY